MQQPVSVWTLRNMKVFGRSNDLLSLFLTSSLLVILHTGKSLLTWLTDFDGRLVTSCWDIYWTSKFFKHFTWVSKIWIQIFISVTLFKLFHTQMFVNVCRKVSRYSVDSPGAVIIFAFVLSVRIQGLNKLTADWPFFNHGRLNKLILYSLTPREAGSWNWQWRIVY